MSHKSSGEQRERAASLVAKGDKSTADVAAELGVTRRTIERWRQQPAFARRVTAICDEFATQLVATGIADRQNRVDALNDAFERIEQVIAERAADPSMQDVPGGKTGIVLRQMKMIGFGEFAVPVNEYVVDTATLRERRATLQQAAQELGQWADKSETRTEQHVRFTISFDRVGQDDHV